MGRRIVVRYMPILFRLLAAIFLWLFFLPLFTAYLYQGWMHKPSSVASRLRWDLITTDAISGAVIAAVIIVSFLSLMSFVDFLRVHWDPQGAGMNNNNIMNNRQQALQQQQQAQRRRRRREGDAAAAEVIQRRQQQQPLFHPMERGALGNGENGLRNPMQEPLNQPIHRPRFAADLEERAMERQHFELLRRREAERRQVEPVNNHQPVHRAEEKMGDGERRWETQQQQLLDAPNEGLNNMAFDDTNTVADTGLVRKASPDNESLRHPTRKRRLNEDEYKESDNLKERDLGDADLSLDDIAHMMKMQDQASRIADDELEHRERIHQQPRIINNNNNNPMGDAQIQLNNGINVDPLPDAMDPDDEMVRRIVSFVTIVAFFFFVFLGLNVTFKSFV